MRVLTFVNREGVRMKWYKRDPDAFIAGTIGLTVEERGAYSLLLDLLYSRDGNVPNDDRFMARALECRPQMWRRIKAALIAKGKIRETGTKLTANRVQKELESAAKLMGNPVDIGQFASKNVNKNNKSNEKHPSKTADTTTTTTTKKISKKRSSLGTHIDENWLASNDDLAFAQQEGLTADKIVEEEAKFRDYWKARSGAGGRKRDWPATWRNWVRNNKQPHRSNGGREPTLFQRKQQELEDVKQSLDESIARHRAARESGNADQASDGVVPFPDRARS